MEYFNNVAYWKRIDVLDFTLNNLSYEWSLKNSVWADVQEDFSKINISSLSANQTKVEFVVRYMVVVGPENIIRYKNKYYQIVAIENLQRSYKRITCGEVTVVDCLVNRYDIGKDSYNRPIKVNETTIQYPSVIVEKYAGFKVRDISYEQEVTYISITHKIIDLNVGELVEITQNAAGVKQGGYLIKTALKMNANYNEYEITKRDDV